MGVSSFVCSSLLVYIVFELLCGFGLHILQKIVCRCLFRLLLFSYCMMYVVLIVRHLKVLLISFGISILRLFWRCFLSNYSNKMDVWHRLVISGIVTIYIYINYCRSLSINSSTVFSQDLRFRYPVAASKLHGELLLIHPGLCQMFWVLDNHLVNIEIKKNRQWSDDPSPSKESVFFWNSPKSNDP